MRATYVPEKACKRGHKLRYLSDRSCAVCRYEAGKQFREEKPEKTRNYLKKYREKDREGYNALIRQWNLENPGKNTVAARKWFTKNPGYVAAAASKRRAKVLKATPKWLQDCDFQQILAFYAEAARLTVETGVPHHVDHVVPLQGREVSGLHVPWNLQVIPAKANHVKSNRLS